MSANLVTSENCPRDLNGLMALSRAVRYRIALSLNLFPNESPEEKAFVGGDDTTQAQTLMTALQNRDQGIPTNGQSPQQQQLPYQQQQQPQYAPQYPPQQQPQYPPQQQQPQYPPQQGAPMQGVVTPQPLAVSPAPYGQPQTQAYQPAYAPPPGAAQSAPPPGYAPPPNALPPAPAQSYTAPGAPPPPMLPPTHQAAPPPPLPTGSYPQQQTGYAPPPQQGGYAPPPAQAPAPQQHQHYAPPPPQQAPVARQPSTMGDPSNAGGRPVGTDQRPPEVVLRDLERTVLGMARMQNMTLQLLLELGQNQLGMDKQTLAKLLVQNSQAGEPERFFDPAALQGKVQ